MARKHPQSATAAIDQQLAIAALDKNRRGEVPSREEREALKRFEERRDEELRIAHFAGVRKKDWREWSGRQDKILNEQAARYGIPIGGATIDIRDVAKWLHDFLAENARRLTNPESDDDEYAGCSSPNLEKYRKARALREHLAYECDLQQWIARDQVHAGMAIIAGIMRTANEALLRQFGANAQKILNKAWDNVEREITLRFGALDDKQPADRE